MFRIIGMLFIIGGCTGIGFFYKNRFASGLMHLRQMQQIMELFISEIRYGKATLPECCRQVADKVGEPYKGALLSVYRELEKQAGIGFFEKRKQRMTQMLTEIPVTKEEKEIFIDFLSGCGHTDNQMQIRAIEQHKDMLLTAIKGRERELEKQGRMAAGLGIMSGLLMVVVLL